MEELSRGIRDLHQRVGELDELLHAHQGAADLRERLAAAGAAAAEGAQAQARRVMRLLLVGLLLWTPVVAYGAVWFHELVRNTCYPGVVLTAGVPPGSDPWYCNIFPGTGHPHAELPAQP